MPEISRFFGIVVRMFVEAGQPDHLPHFHACHQGEVGIYSIERIERIAGTLPRREERLVMAWAELHRAELRMNWKTFQRGRPPTKIDPLGK